MKKHTRCYQAKKENEVKVHSCTPLPKLVSKGSPMDE